MKTARVALSLSLALAFCLFAPRAEAQSTSQNPEILAVLLAPPAVVSLICDIVTVGTLTNGFAWRGSTITGTVLGGVTTLFSFLALAIGLSSSNLFSLWIPASSVGLAFGLGTVLVNLYGLAHPPPDPVEPTRSVQLTQRDGDPNDPLRGVSVPTRAIGSVQFYPQVWTGRGGLGAMGTLSVAL